MSRLLVCLVLGLALFPPASAAADIYSLTAVASNAGTTVCTLRTTNSATPATNTILYHSSLRCSTPVQHLAIHSDLEGLQGNVIDFGNWDGCDMFGSTPNPSCGFDRSYDSGNSTQVAFKPRPYFHYTDLTLRSNLGGLEDPWVTDPRLTCRPSPIGSTTTIRCELREEITLA